MRIKDPHGLVSGRKIWQADATAERLWIVIKLIAVAWMGGGLWLAIVMPTTPAQRTAWRRIYVGVLVALAVLAGLLGDRLGD